VLDLSARTVAATIDVTPHDMPHDVRVSADGATIWVACALTQAVVEMDVASGRIAKTWATGADGGWFVAVTRDDRWIYVPHLEGRRITAIDRTTGTVKTVVDGGGQSGIDVSPDGREVWAVGHDQRRIHVIDAARGETIASIPLEVAEFGRLRFTPNGQRVILVQGRRLAVLDARSRKEIAVLEMPLAGKVLDVSADGRRAAVSNPEQDRVTIIDLEQMRVRASITVGKTPDGVAWID
jgi:DNA-binding beta-propeller fold protein YncE